jgi:hypothetical protein
MMSALLWLLVGNSMVSFVLRKAPRPFVYKMLYFLCTTGAQYQTNAAKKRRHQGALTIVDTSSACKLYCTTADCCCCLLGVPIPLVTGMESYDSMLG